MTPGLESYSDPRDLGGDISGPGGPYEIRTCGGNAEPVLDGEKVCEFCHVEYVLDGGSCCHSCAVVA